MVSSVSSASSVLPVLAVQSIACAQRTVSVSLCVMVLDARLQNTPETNLYDGAVSHKRWFAVTQNGKKEIDGTLEGVDEPEPDLVDGTDPQGEENEMKSGRRGVVFAPKKLSKFQSLGSLWLRVPLF